MRCYDRIQNPTQITQIRSDFLYLLRPKMIVVYNLRPYIHPGFNRETNAPVQRGCHGISVAKLHDRCDFISCLIEHNITSHSYITMQCTLDVVYHDGGSDEGWGHGNITRCNTIQDNAIQYNTMQCNAIQYDTIQYNTIHYITLHYII